MEPVAHAYVRVQVPSGLADDGSLRFSSRELPRRDLPGDRGSAPRWRAFFATAEALEDRIRGLAEDGSQPRALVLDLEGVDFIDSHGAAKLTDIHQLMDVDGVALRLARVKPNVLKVIQADGIIDVIGEDHIHGNVNRGDRSAAG